VERYLDHQFYENVNAPAWRDRLRVSHGFFHEHAWLGVNQRLGDALGYSIIYRDIVNSILTQLNDYSSSVPSPGRGTSSLQQIPEAVRTMMAALTPRKRCPVCEHRDENTHNTLAVLVEELETPEMTNALQVSEGLCLTLLRLALERVNDLSACEKLLAVHRAKLESLRSELEEFIRKNDYQAIQEGFGMVAGSRKGR